MNKADHEIISPTAKYVAHLRAMTGIAYSKEIASVCNTEEVFLKIVGDDYSEFKWVAPLVEARFKSVNFLLEHYGIKNIFDLASGLSPRGLMMTENPEVVFVESDLAELLHEKENIVRTILLSRNEAMRDNLYCASVDVLDKNRLFSAAEHFAAGPIGVVCEGLLNYFTLQEKQRVAENISELLRKYGGVWITPDISTKERSQGIVYDDTDAKKAFELLGAFTGKNLLNNAFIDSNHVQSFFENNGFTAEKWVQGELGLSLNYLDLSKEQRRRVDKLISQAGVWAIKVK